MREQGERARFPWFVTPNMDRLASEGVRFRNAFVVNALCSPSRASSLTGRYNHSNGVVNNHEPFPESAVTHAALLRAAGYRTGYVGKWHMDSPSGKRPGFDYSASFIGHARFHDAPFESPGTRSRACKSGPTREAPSPAAGASGASWGSPSRSRSSAGNRTRRRSSPRSREAAGGAGRRQVETPAWFAEPRAAS